MDDSAARRLSSLAASTSAALLIAALSATAVATPLFSAETQIVCPNCLEDELKILTRTVGESNSLPVEIDDSRHGTFRLANPRGTDLGGTVNGHTKVIASAGELKLHSSANLFAQAFDAGISVATLITSARGSFRVDDAFIGFAGPNAVQLVSGFLRLPIAGSIELGETFPSGLGSGIEVDAQFNLEGVVAGQRFTGGVFRQIIDNLTDPRRPRLTSTDSGIFDGRGEEFLGGADFVLAIPLRLPVNQFFPLEIEASIIDGISFTGSGPFFAEGASGWNLFDTISFPTAGPVIELPEGFTFNSVSGRIVDNQWLGPAVIPPPGATPVPEPSTLALLALAMGIAALRISAKKSLGVRF